MKEDNYDFVETELPNVGSGGMVIPLPNVIDEDELLDDERDALLSPLLGNTYPVLPVFNAVIFPCVLQAVMLTEDKQIDAVSNAMSKGQYIVATTYIGSDPDTPITPGSLAKEGVLCIVEDMIHPSPDNVVAIIRGIIRVHTSNYTQTNPYLRCRVESPLALPRSERDLTKDTELFVAFNKLRYELVELVKIRHMEGAEDFVEALNAQNNLPFLINFTPAYLSLTPRAKLELLKISGTKHLVMELISYVRQTSELVQINEKIVKQTQSDMDEMQRKHFLEQQIRTIREELGEGDFADQTIAELREAGTKKQWSEAVQKTFDRELGNLERIPTQAPEYSIQLQYLRLMLDLPWQEYSQDQFDLKHAEEILNRDHFGLERVKERILEHLAVIKLKNDLKSPILCLYGPPGVGKTSLGKSIAESLGRKYVRISLGGLHDEAEIRGHRRTYIGAMCGRIIDSIKKAGTSNPVFVLDEIDKISSDYKGDPAAALLEVLDPEQNVAFHDNYLDIDYDLSKVLFIATANTLSTISRPLLDRMELIQVSGYLLEEKVEIAHRHLVPKELEAHGLTSDQFTIDTDALTYLIEGYTRESGVRSLQKNLAALMRKQAKRVAMGQEYSVQITPEIIQQDLRTPPYTRDIWQDFGMPGIVTGLAWTEVGGEILFIESSTHRGKEGKVTLTGNLGDVMKESAVIALDYIKAHYEELQIPESTFDKLEIHLHVPEGAIPKDGPSAGITMATSLVSTLTRRTVKPRIAMSGEITLTGRVLPVGGIKEKILAAKRAGVKTLILSKENEKDILDIKPIYIEGLTFSYVETIKEVLDLALND
ncbi:endopeptidase La [uncultured Porphyromonas sp.]|jgi:ATP-dependent Lon protease|uniref:endopeptidase La n=1 Tax=uncultured Porphyromonas sp. TaxID=159274 RepID=UPI00260BF06E|nr:endopeptidase La [uncultured Porphyromonas sp.]